jgi:FkbM family methyltransferase
LKLKDFRGVWLPEDEEHLSQFAVVDDWTYQPHKFLEAVKWVRKADVAVDIGAHCGLWSRMMAGTFKKVYAFEPVPIHREAFEKNVKGDYELFPFACGDRNGEIRIKRVSTSSGCSNVDLAGDVRVKMVRVDDYLDTACDFLKVDVEGYEELALRGARKLLNTKPVVIVEQKPGKARKYGLKETGALKYLRKLGAVERAEIDGDYIFSWNE